MQVGVRKDALETLEEAKKFKRMYDSKQMEGTVKLYAAVEAQELKEETEAEKVRTA